MRSCLSRTFLIAGSVALLGTVASGGFGAIALPVLIGATLFVAWRAWRLGTPDHL